MTGKPEYDIGEVRVDLAEQSVSHGDTRLDLSQKKYFDVLQCLVEHYPNWVTRQQLIQQVWDGNHFVGDKAINNAIWHIRKALADIDPDTQYIVTKRGHGYRLAVEPLLRVADPDQPAAASGNSRRRWIIGGAVVAVALLAVALLVALLSASPRDMVLSNERLTNYPGSEFTPAVDWNRQQLAFTWARPNQDADLYLRPLAGGGPPKQLTHTEQSEHSPVWAPGGEGIYYIERDRQQQRCAVKYLDLATLSRSRITDCQYDLNTHIAIHPSGDFLAVNKTEPGIFNSGIYLVDVKDPAHPERRISCGDSCKYEDRDIAFSGDGKSLAFSRRMDLLSEDIYVRDLDSGEERRITRGESDIKSLGWGKQDGRIVYASKIAGKRVVRMVDLDSGEATQLALPGISSLSQVPGSNRYVYSLGNTDKYIGYLDLGSDLRAAIPLLQANFSQRNAHYSQAQGKLVFCSNESGAMELWASQLDGSHREKITNLNGEVMTPRWSHAGDRIAFVAADHSAAGNQLMVLDFATREVRQIVPGVSSSGFYNFSRPVWSEDDAHLYAAVSTGGEYLGFRFDPAAGGGHALSDIPMVKLLPHGSGRLLFARSDGGLWQGDMDLEAAGLDNVRQLLTADAFPTQFNWDLYRDQVFFQQSSGIHSRVMKLDLRTGKTSGLALVPRGAVERLGDFSYVPEKNWLLFTQRESYQSDIYQFELRD
ncbi:winged helix-turn-helix domain-containing protein [Microbulbifer sp. CAU 1566]|uniref:winged helix-turn-helix domain-containing protein n=1 Tax=Microbulbifer sp. CAU 1566 TaxID=2933269 RepID=UPI0020060DA9|nr:winged helix-turn-helix domain-containing protein [Microbulbifer sp. CAU 1566]